MFILKRFQTSFYSKKNPPVLITIPNIRKFHAEESNTGKSAEFINDNQTLLSKLAP